jgi:hypothetical protein
MTGRASKRELERDKEAVSGSLDRGQDAGSRIAVRNHGPRASSSPRIEPRDPHAAQRHHPVLDILLSTTLRRTSSEYSSRAFSSAKQLLLDRRRHPRLLKIEANKLELENRSASTSARSSTRSRG